MRFAQSSSALRAPPPRAGSAHPKKQEIYSIILEKKYSLKLDIIYFENFIKFKTQNKLYLYEHSLPPKGG
jgi:hypothetical protein